MSREELAKISLQRRDLLDSSTSNLHLWKTLVTDLRLFDFLGFRLRCDAPCRSLLIDFFTSYGARICLT